MSLQRKVWNWLKFCFSCFHQLNQNFNVIIKLFLVKIKLTLSHVHTSTAIWLEILLLNRVVLSSALLDSKLCHQYTREQMYNIHPIQEKTIEHLKSIIAPTQSHRNCCISMNDHYHTPTKSILLTSTVATAIICKHLEKEWAMEKIHVQTVLHCTSYNLSMHVRMYSSVLSRENIWSLWTATSQLTICILLDCFSRADLGEGVHKENS